MLGYFNAEIENNEMLSQKIAVINKQRTGNLIGLQISNELLSLKTASIKQDIHCEFRK